MHHQLDSGRKGILVKIRHNIKTLKNTDAFDGRWYKMDTGFVRITILRDLMFVTSPVADKARDIDVDLPAHPEFYLDIVTPMSRRVVMVAKNDGLKFRLAKGEMLDGRVGLT